MNSLIETHLAWCERRNLRPTYLKALRHTLERLDDTFGPLELVTDDILEDWWRVLDVSPGTRVAYCAHLSSFYRWLIRERLRKDDPTARLVRPRLRRRLPRPIRDIHLHHALERAEPPVSTWLLLACLQGLRACEIATLCREDIRDGVLVVRDGKGGKQRILPLHPLVADDLDGYPQHGLLFLNRAGRATAPNSITQRTSRYLRSVGVPETLHQVRHHFGTSIWRASKDLRLTQELMGHSSPVTTAGYAAWDREAATAAVVGLELPA